MTWAQCEEPMLPEAPVARSAVPVGPPTAILMAAALAAGAAWALAFFPSQAVRIIGWALGSLVTIGLVTRYTVVDSKRSQSPRYACRPALARMRWMVVTAGTLAAVVHTFAFATKVAS